MAYTDGKALVDIVLAQVEELSALGVVTKTHSFKTASEAEIEPEVSEGDEQILRVKNDILAINRTEDIVIGYNITLKQNELIPEVLALVDGGTLKMDEIETTKVIGYSAPSPGVTVARKTVNVILYTAEKDTAGEILGYVKFKFTNAKGTPVTYSMKDGDFFVPEMALKSRPKSTEVPVDIDFIDVLPTIS